MNDELKHAWQSQASPQRLMLDTTLLLKEVRRNENQRCVRKELEPRRQELKALLDSLKEAGEAPDP